MEEAYPPTLAQWAHKILLADDPYEKVHLTFEAGKWWRSSPDLPIGSAPVPDTPPRPEHFKIVEPRKAPKLGKAGSLSSRINILHSLANIEQWAIDTAWDNIARFGSQQENQPPPFPKGYYDDFVKMALDEAKHFNWLIERIEQLGSKFGNLPIHAGIWESAYETKDSMPARMAIVHMVHEARGLDIDPNTINNFVKNGDTTSSEMLENIYTDEITHVEIGTRWFKHYCAENKAALALEFHKEEDPSDSEKDISVVYFHDLVSKHFCGRLKPPFNYTARDQAGLEREFYEPIAAPPKPKQ